MESDAMDLIPLQDDLQKQKLLNTFKDGRKVDFVLAYIPANDKKPQCEQHTKKRATFEKNLQDEGLQLELDDCNSTLHFIKIHVPDDVLRRYCEIMKMKMPIKKLPEQDGLLEDADFVDAVKTQVGRLFNFLKTDTEKFSANPYELTAEFRRDRTYLFDVSNPDFFPEAIRISVVDFILERKSFSEENVCVYDVGIEKLISDGIYKAAYPLHDGRSSQPGCQRNMLLYHWAQVSHWIQYQPIDSIKDYFGVQIALYFSWLGFYTHMLIPASIIGLICFVYGLATLSSNTLSNDICNANLNITMCPLCDSNCDFWKLQDSCIQAKVTYLFDNNFTVVFAVFMSFWSTLYLELWKRYSANITHRWGLTSYSHQAEHPRPQYLAKLAKLNCAPKRNAVTQLPEPAVPFWRVRLPYALFSYSMVLVLIVVVCAAVFGVILFRMSQLTADSLIGGSNNSAVLMPCSAALINLILITFLNITYDWLAVVLTDMEYLRTQTEYDDSLTLKIYLFQFVNYYSSIFYIAFLKGKFVGYPMKYNRILGYRQEECSPGGCFLELFIQLAIIMIGKQAISAIMEMLIPFVTSSFRKFLVMAGFKNSDDDDDGSESNTECTTCRQWIWDYKLLQWGSRGLFNEYLEMVLQYGFVTLFVCAFPLAPFFALINNILEMRLDAKKFLKFYQRPVPRRARNIGIWYSIMDVIGRMSVISNAFMIAFSSNFIPRIVYMLRVSADSSDNGFLEHSLAYFDTNDFQSAAVPRIQTMPNITMCRYPEYRNPPWDDRRYKRSEFYWQVMMARLAFIVVFQNVVNAIRIAVEWAIPDVPLKLRDQIKREAYLTNEIIIREETRKAKMRAAGVARHANYNLCYDHDLGDCSQCQSKTDINEAMINNEVGAYQRKSYEDV